MSADLAELVGRFGVVLHSAGVPVTPRSAGRFADAIAVAQPTRTAQLYWLARVTLVPDRVHFDAFERCFDQVFRGLFDDAGGNRNPNVATSPTTRPSEPSPSGKRRGQPPSTSNDMPSGKPGVSSSTGSNDAADDGVLAAASATERLSARPFGVCTPDELEQVRSLMHAFRLEPPLRRSRRSRVHPLGRTVDLRATLRAAQQTGGDPVRQIRRRRRTRPRRVVLIADVSGSMESYGRAYLYLLHSAVRAVGAEAFVFATQLHRLTRPLGSQHPAQALTRAMASAPDWSGGTRIGEALKAFNNDHARRGIGRGAIVVIVSDGWEAGDAALLGREMERLSRLAYRIVWVNPRKQNVDYQPLVGGMAAALPWVNTFVSGHSLDALDEVALAINATQHEQSRARGIVPTA